MSTRRSFSSAASCGPARPGRAGRTKKKTPAFEAGVEAADFGRREGKSPPGELSGSVQPCPLQDFDVLRLTAEIAGNDLFGFLQGAAGTGLPVEFDDAMELLEPARLRLLDEKVRIELDRHGAQRYRQQAAGFRDHAHRIQSGAKRTGRT